MKVGEHTHSDAIIQLVGDRELLVATSVVGNRESGVVSADLCDVAVFPVAKLRVVVARLRVRRGRRAAC